MITLKRLYTYPGVDPFEQVSWSLRSAQIESEKGEVLFKLDDIEAPADWSDLAVKIAANKYFRKKINGKTPGETSVRSLIARVVLAIAGFAKRFDILDDTNLDIFTAELTYLLLHQKAAFNSPVWFNVGLFEQYGIKGEGGNFFYQFPKSIRDGWKSAPITMRNAGSIERSENDYEHPQASACFIHKVEDDLGKIFDSVKAESRIFKYGSGAGAKFSTLRSRYEELAGGGKSSGMMSFLEVFDRAAGAIKSGGVTRRAAKMIVVDCDHPEILDFIRWKAKEEKKANLLLQHGYSGGLDGESHATVGGQNANNSVRVNNGFMNNAGVGQTYATKLVTSGFPHEWLSASDVLQEIAQATWECGDPGVQYDNALQDWHTVPNSGRINATNPCSEFCFLDDTACNLASLNLTKFINRDTGVIDFESLAHASQIMILAQELLVDYASYPTQAIAQNSHDFRPLGLGYCDLGALIMRQGLPYDSDEARYIAGMITSIMTGAAYAMSAQIAEALGPFKGFKANRDPMLGVIGNHRAHSRKLDGQKLSPRLDPRWEDGLPVMRRGWNDAVMLGEKHGFRNAQVSLLAPTGTIGYLMGATTTGVEPEYGLVKTKRLVGGGEIHTVSVSVPLALVRLGYSHEEIKSIANHLITEGTLAGSALKEEHFAIFACASPMKGRPGCIIPPMAHLEMMSAVQPFLSGAISKTINCPKETTVAEIRALYWRGWQLGLKAVAIYRDGCKSNQPLSSAKQEAPLDQTIYPHDRTPQEEIESLRVLLKDARDQAESAWKSRDELAKELTELRGLHLKLLAQHAKPLRVRLPTERGGITCEVKIGGQKLYVRTGEYADGSLGEIFLDMHKEGAGYRALLNGLAIAVSLGLQYGVPLEEYIDTFTFTRFEPQGVTTHDRIRTATSVVDFIFRFLGLRYKDRQDLAHVAAEEVVKLKPHHNGSAPELKIDWSILEREARSQEGTSETRSLTGGSVEALSPDKRDTPRQEGSVVGDAPPCSGCGFLTERNGTCFRCPNCGESLGCS